MRSFTRQRPLSGNHPSGVTIVSPTQTVQLQEQESLPNYHTNVHSNTQLALIPDPRISHHDHESRRFSHHYHGTYSGHASFDIQARMTSSYVGRDQLLFPSSIKSHVFSWWGLPSSRTPPHRLKMINQVAIPYSSQDTIMLALSTDHYERQGRALRPVVAPQIRSVDGNHLRASATSEVNMDP